MRKEITNFTESYLSCEALKTKESIDDLYNSYERLRGLKNISYDEAFFILFDIKNAEADYTSLDDTLAEMLFSQIEKQDSNLEEIFYINGGNSALIRIKTLLYFQGCYYVLESNKSLGEITENTYDKSISKINAMGINLTLTDLRFFLSTVGYNVEELNPETLHDLKLIFKKSNFLKIVKNPKIIELEILNSILN